jgi:hypothetical protein
MHRRGVDVARSFGCTVLRRCTQMCLVDVAVPDGCICTS